jgi:hypothetical protein
MERARPNSATIVGKVLNALMKNTSKTIASKSRFGDWERREGLELKVTS